MTTTTTPGSSHPIKDGQHSPVLPNYNLTCFKTSDIQEDNRDIVMPYLNIETRGRIVGMRQAGLPFQAILDLVGIPLSTVYDMVAKFQIIGTVRTQKKTGRTPIMTDQDQQELDRIITQAFAHCSQKTLPLASRFPTSPRHWTINDWAWVFWKDESAFELGKKVNRVQVWRTPQEPRRQPLIGPPKPHGMGGILCSNASTFGFSQWANDLDQDGSASLPTGPASVHSLDGAGPLDSWSPPPPFDGGQCPHPHRLASLAPDPEA
ncbi:hypothetical protein O181_055980 [Austropuccinia psidii MF-1]|uniref:Paired domain-containing protein n=1 Tax=Austropuccinia psidii MF-1 TaxID=1389203 RepID=A0A9Q3HVQ6_9BASI|nr:hypothetical protein [Austropuccinia psidii MF-1]